MESTTLAADHGPTPLSERLIFLDVLRGFALFGVIWVGQDHFGFVASPVSTLEWYADWFMKVFAEFKFFGLFTFLFGIGLALQMERIESRGIRFAPRWLARMAALWLIGFAHELLLGNHTLLLNYAVAGCMLLLFRRLSHRVLFMCASAALVLGFFRGSLEQVVERAFPLSEASRIAQQDLEKQEGPVARDRSYADNVRYRLRSFRAYYSSRWPVLGIALNASLPMFILGLYAVRRGVVRDLTAHRRLLWQLLSIGLTLGLVLSYVSVPIPKALPLPQLDLSPQVRGLLVQPAFVLLSLSYAGGLALLFQGSKCRRWLLFLAPVGRMGLSNYVLQSAIMTSIYCGYGLAFYGKLDVMQAILLSAAVVFAQIIVSSLILRRFRYGPLEWVWRKLADILLRPKLRSRPQRLNPQ